MIPQIKPAINQFPLQIKEKSVFDDDFDALMHLWKETNLREAAIQEYFDRNGIVPLTFIYEDFIKDINGAVQSVLDYLEVDYDEINFGKPFYRKIADENSEKWVQRFRADLQKGWKQTVW